MERKRPRSTAPYGDRMGLQPIFWRVSVLLQWVPNGIQLLYLCFSPIVMLSASVKIL